MSFHGQTVMTSIMRSHELATASMIGARGCPWRCSFCSIITFYEGNGTKGRRRRDPVCIVDELEYLHRERGVKIILWQDDDFLAGGKAAIRWAHSIADECIRRGSRQGLYAGRFPADRTRSAARALNLWLLPV